MSSAITKTPLTTEKSSSSSPKKEWQFNLFIAGQTPHGVLTLANLKNFCDMYLPNQYNIEVIDLLQYPERAQEEEIIAIPTIVKLEPAPKRYIIGDFSNHDLMLMKLGINLNLNSKQK
ncbi:KaiB-like protein 2 [Legionella moravica]|uniref:KaiB-like protein 2 n=1 Tax=Legionella moravica TaxID=39962 RepID=A0A378K1V3_9GAMM|nr:circadian clock KaiB family protein [Legionella moravica]KTD38319.1 KaiB-like protein 2 [Legionella moravica]STX63672.1 KaiB-like protein 2 [Legionella moravica]